MTVQHLGFQHCKGRLEFKVEKNQYLDIAELFNIINTFMLISVSVKSF